MSEITYLNKTADIHFAEREFHNDGTDGRYYLLEDGDYPFKVVGLELKRTNGSGKLPPCNVAELTLRVKDGYADVDVRCRLILHRSKEEQLSQFFNSIESYYDVGSMEMDWDKVEGRWGFARFKVEEYTGADGKTYKRNIATRFLSTPYILNDLVMDGKEFLQSFETEIDRVQRELYEEQQENEERRMRQVIDKLLGMYEIEFLGNRYE